MTQQTSTETDHGPDPVTGKPRVSMTIQIAPPGMTLGLVKQEQEAKEGDRVC
jgi:hypothetical protein